MPEQLFDRKSHNRRVLSRLPLRNLSSTGKEMGMGMELKKSKVTVEGEDKIPDTPESVTYLVTCREWLLFSYDPGNIGCICCHVATKNESCHLPWLRRGRPRAERV